MSWRIIGSHSMRESQRLSYHKWGCHTCNGVDPVFDVSQWEVDALAVSASVKILGSIYSRIRKHNINSQTFYSDIQ